MSWFRSLDLAVVRLGATLNAIVVFLAVYLTGSLTASESSGPSISFDTRGIVTQERLYFLVPPEGATPLLHGLGLSIPVLLVFATSCMLTISISQDSRESLPQEVSLGALIGSLPGGLLTLPLVPVLRIPVPVWLVWIPILGAAAFVGAAAGRRCAKAWSERGLGSSVLAVLKIVLAIVLSVPLAMAAAATPVGLLYLLREAILVDHVRDDDVLDDHDDPMVQCCQGDSRKCVEAAESLRMESASPETMLKVRNLYSIGCRESQPETCARASIMHMDGIGGPKDMANARVLASRGCDSHNGDSCSQLAHLMQGLGEDPSGYFPVLEKACEDQSSVGCHYLAIGAKQRHDVPEAYGLFEKACSFGNAASCHESGLMLIEGMGVGEDPEEGRELLGKTCRAGHEPSCSVPGTTDAEPPGDTDQPAEPD